MFAIISFLSQLISALAHIIRKNHKNEALLTFERHTARGAVNAGARGEPLPGVPGSRSGTHTKRHAPVYVAETAFNILISRRDISQSQKVVPNLKYRDVLEGVLWEDEGREGARLKAGLRLFTRSARSL